MRGFDRQLQDLLAKNPEAAVEYTRLFAELPLTTQLAIMRRQRKLSQRAMAKKIRLPQPHVARAETASHNPRLSTIVKLAKALRCHVVLVPDEKLARLTAA